MTNFSFSGAPNRWFRGRVGGNIDIFSGTSVVELFARFPFDRPVIGLHRFDAVNVFVVFFLQAFDFGL